MDKLVAKLALIAAFFALIVIGLGAFTRLMDAGLGCPDWPGCYGHLTAPLSGSLSIIYKSWAEMIHRYCVALLSLFMLALLGLIFCKKKLRTRGNMIFALVLILLLSYQIFLGSLTVTLKLLPIIVTQHLLGGFLILTTVWLLFLKHNKVFIPQKNPEIRAFIPWAFTACFILLAQILLGAWTSTHYASLSCPDFPFCINQSAGISWTLNKLYKFFRR